MFNTKNPALNGPWAPITEELVINDLKIEGNIPKDLVGTLCRNSYNQRFAPLNADNYHIFDGDGMVYSIELKNGKASYRNRWVANDGAKAELAAGRTLYNGLYSGSGVQQPALPSGAPPVKHVGSVNVIRLGDRMLALQETGDCWWELNPTTLEVIAPFDFFGATREKGALTAHPHTDPTTGNLIFLQLNSKANTLNIMEAAPNGTIVSQQSIAPEWSAYIHDMIFTKEYYVVMLGPIAWNTDFSTLVRQGRSSWSLDPARGSRILLINRKDGSLHSFDDEPNQLNHYLNAYQDGDHVIIDASVNPIMGGTKDTIVSDHFPISRTGDWHPVAHAALWRWTINTARGTVKREHVGGLSVDFPRPNEKFMGSKHRYGYFMNASVVKGASGAVGNTAVKHDYQTGISRHQLGSKEGGFNVGEPLFIPRKGATVEDDGYVLVIYRHVPTRTSQLLILDAQNFDGEPIARVKIDTWLPTSVHGNWIESRH
jgi:carotenoid cleavage dioxygenase